MTRRKYPSDMKPRKRPRGAGQLTVSLGDMKPVLDRIAKQSGRTPSQVLRELIEKKSQDPVDSSARLP